MTKHPKTPETVTVNLPLPVELHSIAKSEAAKARKTLRAFIVEALRAHTKRAA